MAPSPRSIAPPLLLLLVLAACGASDPTSDIKGPGVFTHSNGYLIEMRKLGTLGHTYGPRLYPEIPEYDIPVVTDIGPIYVNVPDVPVVNLKGIEWRGYRLGGNASPGSPSTAKPDDWKAVEIVVTEEAKRPGLYKVVVASADAKTGRWKPQSNHEYFGVTVDAGFKGGPIWAVKIQ